MKHLKKYWWLLAVVLVVFSCRHVDRKDYGNFMSMLKDIGKAPTAEYNTFPPRLVKTFLRFEKEKNPALIELLSITNGFVVVNIATSNNRKYFVQVLGNVKFQLKKDGFSSIRSIEIEDIKFRQFIIENEDADNAMVIEIEEPGMYTIYYLTGTFSKDVVVETNKKVSPIEFLKLNRKIRQK